MTQWIVFAWLALITLMGFALVRAGKAMHGAGSIGAWKGATWIVEHPGMNPRRRGAGDSRGSRDAPVPVERPPPGGPDTVGPGHERHSRFRSGTANASDGFHTNPERQQGAGERPRGPAAGPMGRRPRLRFGFVWIRRSRGG
jgi:hypothetical protein